MTGADLIRAERHRQEQSEGYTAEHDAGHQVQLVHAASRYARDAEAQLRGITVTPGNPSIQDERGWPFRDWPWADEDYKPGPDAVRTLVKAGALIAAAIDSIEANR